MTIPDSVETTSPDAAEPVHKVPVISGVVTCLLEHVKIEPEVSLSENNSLIQTYVPDYSSAVPKEEESCLTINSLMMIQPTSSDHDYSWTLPKPESCSTVVNNTLSGAQQKDSLNEEQTERTKQTKCSDKGNVSRMSEPEKTFQVNHSVIRLD